MIFKEEHKFKAELANLVLNNNSCHLLLPLDFINVSGKVVSSFSNFFKIVPEEILVVHDDLDLAPGVIKFKSGGGHAGHNGLRDIITCLQTKNFHRLRIGIGHPGARQLVVDYVLGKPLASDKHLIDSAILRGLEALPSILAGDFAKAMQRLH